MLVDIKIGKTKTSKNATCLRAGLWRILVYSAQNALPPFMSRGAAITPYAAKVDEVVIGHVSYEEAASLDALSPGRFFQQNEACYFIIID